MHELPGNAMALLAILSCIAAFIFPRWADKNDPWAVAQAIGLWLGISMIFAVLSLFLMPPGYARVDLLVLGVFFFVLWLRCAGSAMRALAEARKRGLPERPLWLGLPLLGFPALVLWIVVRAGA